MSSSPSAPQWAKNILKVLLGILTLLVALILMVEISKKNNPTDSPPDVARELSQQEAFAAIINDYRSKAEPDDADIMHLSAERRDKLCELFKNGMEVKGWTGTFDVLFTKGRLSVFIGDIENAGKLITLHNHDSFHDRSKKDGDDIYKNIFLPVGSPILAAAQKMQHGQKVTFSGSFLPSKQSCIAQSTMDDPLGNLIAPWIIFRFTNISPVP